MRSFVTTPTSSLYLDHTLDDPTDTSYERLEVDQPQRDLHAVPVQLGLESIPAEL